MHETLRNVWKEGRKDGKLSPCFFLTEHHAMRAYWGNRGIAPRIPVGGKWSASRPGRFTLRKRAPGKEMYDDNKHNNNNNNNNNLKYVH
jgi:hypothetical protein